MDFNLISSLKPAGDQPEAIKSLFNGLKNNKDKQTLLGVTGSGKTFTIANIIQKTQLPTLIISHNKTLAAQLYQEFKELFPENKVSYFVSYYDYYQPESYLPASDTYIAKEVEINDLIDKLRLETTSNLFSGKDNIVVASVSCIYNIGDPRDFSGKTITLKVGDIWSQRQLFSALVSIFYNRSQMEFSRGQFRVRGESVEIWPSYADWILTLEMNMSGKITNIFERNPFTNNQFSLSSYQLFPGKQFVGASGPGLKEIIKEIKADAVKESAVFESQGKILEAHRLRQRVDYDMEMLEEIGYVNGIENYSIYFEKNRHRGDPPYTLIDYFHHLYGNNFLTVIDESHVTIPQIGGMSAGDASRKQSLVDFGFRLKSAYDNRPLRWNEFYERIPKAIYVSATPAEFEIEDSHNQVVEQIIRPTGLLDPPIEIRSSLDQIPNLISEIKKRVVKRERTLVVTLTKKMAEELSAYLSDSKKTGENFKVAYLHSDIETLERTEILDKLRVGDFDVLVGINLLREGLDLPEVSLVTILDAGNQGFLRSKSSLIQIMGRASRNVSGSVILYADQISEAMRQAISEVNRRRKIQIKYNQEHNITPQSITKSIRPKLIESVDKDTVLIPVLEVDPGSLTPNQRKGHLIKLRKEMRTAATNLDFETAIKIRDRIKEIETL